MATRSHIYEKKEYLYGLPVVCKPVEARKVHRGSKMLCIKTCSFFFGAGDSNAEDAEEALLDDEAGQVRVTHQIGDYELLSTADSMP